jgi:hypothetical protein
MPLSRTAVVGLTLAIVAGLASLAGEAFGLSLNGSALVGFGAGAAVGLVPDRSVLARGSALALGLVVGFIGFALTAALLPDTDAGRAVGLVLTLALATLVVIVGLNRLPLWSVLVGVVAFGGVFGASFAASPGSILTEGPVAMSSVLLAGAIGFALTSLPSATLPTQPTSVQEGSVTPMASAEESEPAQPTASDADEGLALVTTQKEMA